MTVHRATCEDCAWSYQDEDLIDVSDEMERHARKEMHDIDLERAVATDGGQCEDAADQSRTRKFGLPHSQVSCPIGRILPFSNTLPAYVAPQSSHTAATRLESLTRSYLRGTNSRIHVKPNLKNPNIILTKIARICCSIATETDPDDDREIRTDGGHSVDGIDRLPVASHQLLVSTIRAPNGAVVRQKLPLAAVIASAVRIMNHVLMSRPNQIRTQRNWRLLEGDGLSPGGLRASDLVPSLLRKSDTRSWVEMPFRHLLPPEVKTDWPAHAGAALQDLHIAAADTTDLPRDRPKRPGWRKQKSPVGRELIHLASGQGVRSPAGPFSEASSSGESRPEKRPPGSSRSTLTDRSNISGIDRSFSKPENSTGNGGGQR